MEEKIVPGYALDLIVEQHKAEKLKLWIALAVVFIALIGTNTFWIIREFQYEDIVMTQTVSSDGAGDVTLNGTGNGDLNYYGNESDTDDKGTP